MPAFTLGTIGCGAECECSAPPCDTTCPLPCDPCPLPAHDLRASVGVETYTPSGCAAIPEICGVTILSGVDTFGFTDLVFDGVDEWVSPTIVYQASYLNNLYQPTGPDPEDVCTFEYVFTLKCDAGAIKLFADHVGGTCTDWRDSIVGLFAPFASGETSIEVAGGVSRSCLPFNVTFALADSTAEPPAGGRVTDVCPPVNAGCCPVEFTVVDCFGDPLSGVYVKVEDGFGNPEDIRADGTTNGSGVVALDVLQAGTYTVTVAYAGFAAADIALACEGAYEIAPDECCIVTLTILDCNGDPIVGAAVEVYDGFDLIASGTTNGSGVVVLNVLAAGTYTVTVDADGYTPRDLALACDTPYTLEPDPENCGVPCEICVLPTENLNYSYSSTGVGGGTGTMIFNGVDTWESGCITETLSGGPFFFKIALVCTGDVMVAYLRHYTASGCATLNTSCASNGSNPNRLVFDSATDDCDPVYLRWTLTGTTCSFFGGFPAGFTEITVYE